MIRHIDMVAVQGLTLRIGLVKMIIRTFTFYDSTTSQKTSLLSYNQRGFVCIGLSKSRMSKKQHDGCNKDLFHFVVIDFVMTVNILFFTFAIMATKHSQILIDLVSAAKLQRFIYNGFTINADKTYIFS